MGCCHTKKTDSKIGETSTSSRTEVNWLESWPDYTTSKKRMFVCSILLDAELQQKGFDEKKVLKSTSSSDSGKAVDFNDCGIGYACKKGLKPESPNQDDFCIFVTDSVSILGVFDGHGPYGHDTASFVHEILPQTVAKHPRFHGNQDDPAEALMDSFHSTHRQCVEKAAERNFDCSLSGTTATLVLLKPGSCYVAHVGDSRAVIAFGNGKRFQPLELTKDHKPDCEVEEKRILESGQGQIRRLEGDIPPRVFIKGQMYPGLAMTRSIGDTVGEQAGVISTPDVNAHHIREDWRFLLMCSDGVWEFINSQEAVDIVARHGPSECQKGADALAAAAWNQWIKEEKNVVDDITVIVHWFSK